MLLNRCATLPAASIIIPPPTSKGVAFNAQVPLLVVTNRTPLLTGWPYALYSSATVYSPTATLPAEPRQLKWNIDQSENLQRLLKRFSLVRFAQPNNVARQAKRAGVLLRQ